MTDIYLKTTSKADFISDMKDIAQFVRDKGAEFGGITFIDEDDNEQLREWTAFWSIAYYGQRVKVAGEYDEDGNEITAPEYWSEDRVNIRLHDAGLEQILGVGSANQAWRPLVNTTILNPSESRVVFAGDKAPNEILPTG